MKRIALVLSLMVGVEAAGQGDADVEGILLELATSADRAASVAEGLERWDLFIAQMEAFQQAGISYSREVWDLLWFQATFEQAALIERLGQESLATLQLAEEYYRAYLNQFETWGVLPEHLDFDPWAAAQYGLGSNLYRQGVLHDEAAETALATRAWTAAREVLRLGLEAIVGHALQEPHGDGWAQPSPRLGMMAALYLQVVSLLEGPGGYVAAARQSYSWLPRDDHQVISQMREQAWNWTVAGQHGGEAQELFALVRKAHRELWEGQYAALADNLLSLIGGIAVALRLQQWDDARALLAELEALLPSIQPPEVRAVLAAKLAELWSRHNDGVLLAALLEEIMSIPPPEGAPADDASASGSGIATLRGGAPALQRPVRGWEADASEGATAPERVGTPGSTGRGRRLAVALGSIGMLAGALLLRRRKTAA